MNDIVLDHVRRMEVLQGELASQLNLRKHILSQFSLYFKQYQKRKLTYTQYERRLTQLFDGKGKEDWLVNHSALIHDLINKISFFNKQIFFRVYSEHAVPQDVRVVVNTNPVKRAREKEEKVHVEFPEKKEVKVAAMANGGKKTKETPKLEQKAQKPPAKEQKKVGHAKEDSDTSKEKAKAEEKSKPSIEVGADPTSDFDSLFEELEQ